MEIDEGYQVVKDDGVEGYNVTEWVNAKWFMRNSLNYNNFTEFIGLYCNELYEDGISNIYLVSDDGERLELNIPSRYEDPFFDFTPQSDRIFIKIKVKEFDEPPGDKYNREMYLDLLRKKVGESNVLLQRALSGAR
jgi:hypothetical protein